MGPVVIIRYLNTFTIWKIIKFLQKYFKILGFKQMKNETQIYQICNPTTCLNIEIISIKMLVATSSPISSAIMPDMCLIQKYNL